MNEAIFGAFKRRFKPNQVISDPQALIVYDLDASHSSGTPEAVFYPETAEEVTEAVKLALKNDVAIVARGAGTGLSGGAVAEQGGLLIHFTRMQRILELDTVGRSALVEPGLVNQHFAELVQEHGLHYPPDPASGRSATLGGNVAENSGGPHCFKYGVTTNYITGLEIVDSTGRLVKVGGKALDYPEYNLTSLLVGSEGTLGIITKIYTRLLCQPPAVKTMMVAFDSVQQAGMAVSAMIAAGLVPAAMEMMDQKIARIVEDYAHPGIPTDAAAILIIEVDGYPSGLDDQIEEIVKILPMYGGRDMRIASDETERQQIWFARKSAIGALARLAPAYLLVDGTVARSKLAEALQATDRICDDHELQVGYVFHAGDGNLHPLILMYPDDAEQVARVRQAAEEFMHEVVKMGGSITGEHGIGIEKRAFLPLMYSAEELEIMKDVKRAFDSRELFNPGKIFPFSEAEPDKQSVNKLKGITDLDVFQPKTISEAATGLAALTNRKAQVRISGSLEHAPEELLCSTRSLDGIIDYAPDDLYITVGAGISLHEVQGHIGTDGLWAALKSPWQDVTLGGLIASNLNAPLRMRYGSIADQLLAMTIILADGRLIRAGRPVVKNVAGYDLPKLMVGSHGSLGLIAEVTLKLHVRPNARRTLLVPIHNLSKGISLGISCLPLAYNASGILVGQGMKLPGLLESEFTLVYTTEGLQADVEAELEQVRQNLTRQCFTQFHEVEAPSGVDFWAEFLEDPDKSLKLRVGLPVKEMTEYVNACETALRRGSSLYDIANGMLYTISSYDEIEEAKQYLHELRPPALDMGGYALVIQSPREWEEEMDPWGYTPEALPIMERLKTAWDPAGILPRVYLLNPT